MRRLKIACIVLLSATLFCGCASGVSGGNSKSMQDGVSVNSVYGGADELYNESVNMDSTQDNTQGKNKDINSTKMVYSCNIQLETLEYDTAYKNIKQQIDGFNGFIETENERDNDYNWYQDGHRKQGATKSVNITARIPSDKYDKFLKKIETEGKVVSKQSAAENISKEYSDTEAVIKSLKIQEERLLEMMETAKSIQDMIAVENRLTEVQTQLNMHKTNLASMQSDVDYSTVRINLNEVLQYTPKETTFLDRLAKTFSLSWNGVKGTLEGLLFLTILAAPQVVIFGSFILVAVLIIRKIMKKKKK